MKHSVLPLFFVWFGMTVVTNCGGNPTPDDNTPTVESPTPGVNDADDDGMTAAQGDCDDNDLTTYFGAPELCDGLDNDCDGLADEGLATDCWQWDEDEDSFTPDEGDCDDHYPSTHPNAEEICDGLDNDCNGVVPIAESNPDDDISLACYEGEYSDCDDADPNTFPFWAPELCDDKDQDCDGTAEDAWTEDVDGDGFVPCDGDCNDTYERAFPGALEFCDGEDNDCDGSADEDFVSLDKNGDGTIDSIECNEADADADGHTMAADCDEWDPTIYNGAPELCDGLDNDCDFKVDEGCHRP